MWAGNEFLGTLHRDDEDGEVSYSVQITILDEDLPERRAAERRNDATAEVGALLHGVGDQFQQFLPIDRLDEHIDGAQFARFVGDLRVRQTGDQKRWNGASAGFNSRSKASPVISGIF